MLLILVSGRLTAQEGKLYFDGHDGKVYFPLGDISFADAVVSFKKGNPSAGEKECDPENALGIPDFDEEKDENYVSLGCGGELIVMFTDNLLTNIPGNDLYIFEIGSAIESTKISISNDGDNWIEIGRVEGGRANIDISSFVKQDEVFRYVKLVDLKSGCDGSFPGADIDAIGAIGTNLKYSINSSVLFDFGKATLKDSIDLSEIVAKINEFNGRVVVEGYTDNIGTNEYNQSLSLERANAVKKYLTKNENISPKRISVRGYGENNPVASNKAEESRQLNRRVEIVVSPEEVGIRRDVTGEWETNWGAFSLHQQGNKVFGWYTSDNGEITGKMVDTHTFEGKWVEDHSSQKCKYASDNRFYWGKLSILFNSNFSSFRGKWNYCEGDPSTENLIGKKLIH